MTQRSAKRCVFVRQLQSFPEKRRGFGPAPALERANAAQLVGQPALQQQIEFLLQRIWHEEVAVAPLPEVGLGFVQFAEAAIGHRERRVEALGLGIDGQRLLEILHGSGVIVFGKRHASQAGQHGHGARRNRERSGEQRLGIFKSALVEIQAPEPHKRRHVVRPHLENTRERSLGLLDFASAFVQVSEIVRPAHLARRERLRVEVARLGGIVVFGGLENHSELAVRRCEIGRSNGAVHLPRQCGVALACLRLHGFVHPREIRQRNRQQFLA